MGVRRLFHMAPPEEVLDALENKPYHTESAGPLEAYLEQQLASGEPDLDANTGLLKLYQFYPDLTNVAAVRKALILAIKALPAIDLQLCLCLVAGPIQQEPEIAALIQLWNQLETADFAGFWAAAKGVEGLLTTPGMAEALRSYIVSTLSTTYLNVPKSILCSSLDVQLSELKSCEQLLAVTENNAIDEAADTVSFQVTKDNHF